MIFMFPRNICVGVLLAISLLFLSAAVPANSQSRKQDTKKAAASKKPEPKKSEKQAKDSRNGRENKGTAHKGKKGDDKKKAADKARDRDRDKRSADKNSKRESDTAKNKKREHSKDDRADARSKKDDKKSQAKAEARREAEERRRREEERRQAILEERRRREQAAREARERKIAFERGLRTETIANIAKDQTEGEDPVIRQAAISALGSHAGSVVVMEAKTGKVLTIVNQDWAVRSSIRPCSTIKLVTGVAGINEGVIDKDHGVVRNVSTRRDLDDALAFSDNPYFQRVGGQLGNQKLVEYGKALGLGQPTGINLEGETPGRLPYNNNNPRIYSHGDDTEVSTIQLAVMASAITNGGNKVLPRIPRNTLEKTQFQTFYRGVVDLPAKSVRRVIPGMMGAAEYGTARRGVDARLGIAGKTGSCIDKGSWVGLFASVAPIEDPKYAVAVITRGQNERGRHAAAIAGQVYRALSSRIVRTNRDLAQTEFKLRPRTAVELRQEVTAAANEGEDDEPGLESPRSQPIYITPPPQKKLVTKTASSKPTFPPVVITYDKDAKRQHERPVKP
jgi:penicillin-binding protein 2